MTTRKAETFNYVVARPWPNPEDGLCIYAYGSQVKRGTMADAEDLLEYVRFSARNEPEKKYDIYRVTFEQITVPAEPEKSR